MYFRFIFKFCSVISRVNDTDMILKYNTLHENNFYANKIVGTNFSSCQITTEHNYAKLQLNLLLGEIGLDFSGKIWIKDRTVNLVSRKTAYRG